MSGWVHAVDQLCHVASDSSSSGIFAEHVADEPAAIVPAVNPKLASIVARTDDGHKGSIRGRGRPRICNLHREQYAAQLDVGSTKKHVQRNDQVNIDPNSANQNATMSDLELQHAAVLAMIPRLELDIHRRMLRHLFAARSCCNPVETSGEVGDTDYKNTAAQLLQFSEHVMSKTIMAHLSKMSTTMASNRLSQVANSLVAFNSMSWSLLFSEACRKIKEEGYEGLVIGRIRKYDESPFKVRVNDNGDILPRGRQQSRLGTNTAACTAKVVSTKHRLFVLLRGPGPNPGQPFSYCLLHGDAPSRLHVVQKQTAFNIKMCQDACVQDVPIPDELSKHFKLKLSLPTTDRFSSMLLAEKWMHKQESCEVTTSHALCAIHRVALAQSHMFSLVSDHVSGALSTALSMQSAGTSADLREAMMKVFEERLVVLQGPPAMEEYRQQIYDIFLPLSGTDAFQHAKQRSVLQAFLNGNIQDRNRIVHMSEDPCVTKESLLPFVKEFVLPALLPKGTAPFFQQIEMARWRKRYKWAWAAGHAS